MEVRGLRSGWKVAKFGDVVRQVKDRVIPQESSLKYYLGGEHFNKAAIHVNGRGVILDSSIGPAFHMRFKPGQVLLVSRNPHLRKASIAEFEGICSNTTYVCETDGKNILPELLPFLMQTDSFWMHAERNKRGSTNPYLNWGDFARFEFLLPPVSEQKRIANILWAVDEIMELFDKILEKLQKIREEYIQSLILKGYNEKWPLTKLVDCFEIASGQVDPKDEPYLSMPLIAPNHIEKSTGRLIDIKVAKEQNAISGKFLFQTGDVVYSKIRPNLRKAFIADFDGLCSSDMYVLKSLPDRILNRFLLSILLSQDFTSFAITYRSGTAIPRLNRKGLSEYKLPLPCIEKQIEISSYIETLDDAEENLIKHKIFMDGVKNKVCRTLLRMDNV